jgi:hypothetical protein
LISVVIPSSVTRIENAAFSSCTSLTSIAIPSNVISIGYLAFNECTSMTEINVNDSNANYSSVDGVLYNKNVTTLIKCPNGKAGVVAVPDSVTRIWELSFAGCSFVTSILIPDSVTDIGRWAFGQCTSLTSITVPNGVTVIGNSTFDGCSSLATVTIGSGVIAINEAAFSYCSALTSVDIPGSVQIIGYATFKDCTSLTSIRFLGMAAPSTVGDFWVYGTSVAIRGHAYATSDFPAPGNFFHGLMMGDRIPSATPGTPQDINAIEGDAQVFLTWTAPADNDNSSITNYKIYRSATKVSNYVLIASPNSLTYTDTWVINGQTYWYRISAVNSSGEGSKSAPISSTPYTVPNAPTLSPATADGTQVALSWSANGNGGSPITGYKLYRRGSENETYELISSPAGLNFTDSGRIEGQAYWYKVSAMNAAGEGANSTAISILIPEPSPMSDNTAMILIALMILFVLVLLVILYVRRRGKGKV